MSTAIVHPATKGLQGSIRLPGDKSISQRRALMSLFVSGEVALTNYGSGDDCQITLSCLKTLGKTVVQDGTMVRIAGSAECHSGELFCGNSGTTARLLMGILSGKTGEWVLTGDDSLSRRPMERVAIPLREMGAQIELTDGHLPVRIRGRRLQGLAYDSPVTSAQVKSAVLLAGLSASSAVRYRETVPTRDHTERVLGISRDIDGWITLNPPSVFLNSTLLSAAIPSDPSSAAFWIAAALMIPDSNLDMHHVLLNPHRIMYIGLLHHGRAKVEFCHVKAHSFEDVGTLRISFSHVQPFQIRQPDTAQIIDEIPVLSALATTINGVSSFYNAGELRVKESDRLRLITENLLRMGANVDSWDDGFSVAYSPGLHGAEIQTEGDHRIAMAFAIAGLRAHGQTTIHDADCVSVSYPDFWANLASLSPGSVDVI